MKSFLGGAPPRANPFRRPISCVVTPRSNLLELLECVVHLQVLPFATFFDTAKIISQKGWTSHFRGLAKSTWCVGALFKVGERLLHVTGCSPSFTDSANLFLLPTKLVSASAPPPAQQCVCVLWRGKVLWEN